MFLTNNRMCLATNWWRSVVDTCATVFIIALSNQSELRAVEVAKAYRPWGVAALRLIDLGAEGRRLRARPARNTCSADTAPSDFHPSLRLETCSAAGAVVAGGFIRAKATGEPGLYYPLSPRCQFYPTGEYLRFVRVPERCQFYPTGEYLRFVRVPERCQFYPTGEYLRFVRVPERCQFYPTGEYLRFVRVPERCQFYPTGEYLRFVRVPERCQFYPTGEYLRFVRVPERCQFYPTGEYLRFVRVPERCQFYPTGEYLRFVRVPERCQFYPTGEYLRFVRVPERCQFYPTGEYLRFVRVPERCQFYPTGEYLRFVRVPESVACGGDWHVSDWRDGVLAGCQFYPTGEYLRFVRVPESVAVGGEVLQVEVHPRHNISLQPVDKAEDAAFFSLEDSNPRAVSVRLAQSLDGLVDSDTPQNVLKFRLVCDHLDGDDTISSYLSVTVYVEDVNDHAPEFQNAPYHVTVEELSPVGLTIFRGVHAVDRDKPNTPNSDVQYALTEGNEKGCFALESSHRAALVLRRALDYDTGDVDFQLTVMASDRGSPPKNSTTSIRVTVLDNDDLGPKFTRDVYRTKITEFYPLTGRRVHQELRFEPPVEARDQDLAIDAPLRYDLVAGNERRLFAVDARNGSLFLERELDLEQERGLPGNTFTLQLQAAQLDNPLRAATARLEVEVLDLNDNLPQFEHQLYNISIVENLPNGFSVLQVVARDLDQGDNGEFTYQLEDPRGAFVVDPRTGWLTVRDQAALDRERQSSLTMRVEAREKVPSAAGSQVSAATVEVTLLDANDNNPAFVPSNLYEFSVESDVRVGSIVGQVHATDPDLGRNGMVLYELQRPGNGSQALALSVDARSGQLVVIDSPLAVGRHALLVQAADQPANPSERRFSLAVVTVHVTRPGGKVLYAFVAKDNDLPDFIGAPYEFWVGYNVPVGTSVGQIRVTDAVDKNTVIYDMLHSYHDGVPFAVEERSGTISVMDEIAKYEPRQYEFEAVVSDGRDVTLVSNVTIHVVEAVQTSSELANRSSAAPLQFRVRENVAGALVGQLGNTSAGWRNMRFMIANQQDVAERFAVTQDGALYTQRPLDREERASYRLTLVAESPRGLARGPAIYQVDVAVEDENDNPPVFERPAYEGRVRENSPAGTEVSLDSPVRARDADAAPNAQFSFTLHGDGSELFALDQAGGRVLLKAALLDRETKAMYSLMVVARDKGNLNSEAKLTIHVDDVNDNAPNFLQMVALQDQDIEISEPTVPGNATPHLPANMTSEEYVSHMATTNFTNHDNILYVAPLVTIPEDTPVGMAILRLLADDRDAGSNATIAYSISSETFIPNLVLGPPKPTSKNYFLIHPVNGEVSVARILPPVTEFRLNFTATDGGGLSDNVSVRIYVKDVNDHAPVFKKSWYMFDLKEGFYSGYIVGKVEATDSDFGPNSEISYTILQSENASIPLPFRISRTGGEISVNGNIDRESKDHYKFRVMSQDGGTSPRRKNSVVNVEVHVLDVNDNAPTFYNYDHILQVFPTSVGAGEDRNPVLIPVYYASVLENSPAGTIVSKVSANDSDFQGNGNGLLLFDIPRRTDGHDSFSIDSKEGLIRTAGALDYERRGAYNVTVVASDLGSPSLSSTAVVAVSVVDLQEEAGEPPRPVFAHRYYEVELPENSAPARLLDLEVTEAYRDSSLRFSLAPSPGSERFQIHARNGTLVATGSLDREQQALYELRVRVEQLKKGRGLPVLLYPLPAERLADLAANEVKVIVRVKDVNDNSPKFVVNGRPIVAAIPTSASYGYHIVRLQATDADEGVNADLRYQILGRADDQARRFAVDALTGQVRSVASFARDAGRVFGFDVKATDRRGADDGRSAITNVFVYVLDDRKQLILTLGTRPTSIEKNIENITNSLYNITGLDVRVRKIEPHSERDLEDGTATDLFLYAVDPLMNVIIDMDTLQNMLQLKRADMERELDQYRVLDVAPARELVVASAGTRERVLAACLRRCLQHAAAEAGRHGARAGPVPGAGRGAGPRAGGSRPPGGSPPSLSALEVGVVALACVVFAGALAAAVCVACLRRGRRRRQQERLAGKMFHPPVGFTFGGAANPALGGQHPLAKAHLFSASYLDALAGDTTDTYVDMHSNKSGGGGYHRHDYHLHDHLPVHLVQSGGGGYHRHDYHLHDHLPVHLVQSGGGGYHRHDYHLHDHLPVHMVQSGGGGYHRHDYHLHDHLPVHMVQSGGGGYHRHDYHLHDHLPVHLVQSGGGGYHRHDYHLHDHLPVHLVQSGGGGYHRHDYHLHDHLPVHLVQSGGGGYHRHDYHLHDHLPVHMVQPDIPDTTDTYVDMHSNKSGGGGYHRHDYHLHDHLPVHLVQGRQRPRRHQHEPSCGRHPQRRATVGPALETSMTSLHSSSKDSGIAEHTRCVCGHSTSPSSADSSNGSYEDSLKSLHRQQTSEATPADARPVNGARRPGGAQRRRQRHNSVSSFQQPPPAALVALPAPALARRPSNRVAAGR
ncbi:LOW QUALITY PROTEIN: cadherin-89D [Bacillus rossius redtenbacheri]|uniref:LOW QUALITY PROTEIN: cadherin-89D n=1 Tax=Bacillus rossius redtenbacheri TaxID=93214 RepID=UPI002FDDFDE0